MPDTPTKNPSDTTDADFDAVLVAAASAAPVMAASGLDERAGWLRAAADALDAAAAALVPLAIEESGLTEVRLTGEVARSSGQLRLFADALADGSLSEIVIDTADPDFKPVPRPDLRRTLVPLGPVAVFGASNFPFAFSVSGGDTASALAAGCPVVVKGHPGHPRLSVKVAEVMASAMTAAGAPDGVLGLVLGQENGVRLLTDERITAGGFTGSVPAGLALHRIASERDQPIPFYGELGSLNPTFVTQAALDARADDIVSGFVGSFTLGVGQFCTKPGLLFVPSGHGLEDKLKAAVAEVAPARMLNPGILAAYRAKLADVTKRPEVEVISEPAAGSGDDVRDGSAATLLTTTSRAVLDDPEILSLEVFGPASLLITYDGVDDLMAAAQRLEGNLTATIHAEGNDGEGGDKALALQLLQLATAKAGRVLWNGWPTGVTVSWAQTHAGPFPSTVGSVFTSVGMTAARRFQRPVSYQSAPTDLLPAELADHNPHGLVRRINGVMSTGDVER